jgi:hypothetical protein
MKMCWEWKDSYAIPMEVGVQLHALASLPLEKEHSIFIRKQAGWVPVSV